jgi:hypothetical protein
VFVARYALPWVWGFSVLTAWSAAALSRRPRLTAVVMAVTFLGWTAGKEAASARLLRADPPTLSETRAALLGERDGTLPIAVTHGHVYLPLAAYAPPEIVSRLVALTQPDRITARMGSRSGDAALIGLAKWAPLQVEDFDAFVRSHRRFLLYGPPMWLTGELRAAGARLTLKGEDEQVAPFAMSDPGGAFLYEVEFDRGK